MKPRCIVRGCKRPARILDKLCTQHGMAKADDWFSKWVRERDKVCTALGLFDLDCSPVLQAAHIVGRNNYATRYDPENVHAMCAAHHYLLDKPGREGHKWVWASQRFTTDFQLEKLYRRSLDKVERVAAIEEALSQEWAKW